MIIVGRRGSETRFIGKALLGEDDLENETIQNVLSTEGSPTEVEKPVNSEIKSKSLESEENKANNTKDSPQREEKPVTPEIKSKSPEVKKNEAINTQDSLKKVENLVTPEFKSYSSKVLNRDVKVTYIYLDNKSPSPNDFSPLIISEHYSVVFCLPPPDRCKPEDLNLLQPYLRYRQREDYSRITVAFVEQENADNDTSNGYEAKRMIPDYVTEFLKPYENRVMYFSSDKKQNNSNIHELVKPIPIFEFYKQMIPTLVFYMWHHLYFYSKF